MIQKRKLTMSVTITLPIFSLRLTVGEDNQSTTEAPFAV